MENYYEILGITRKANEKEITAAYRAKALIYHPDKQKKNSDSHNSEYHHEIFLKIKHAYQQLQDPRIKAALDLRLIAEEERKARDAQMSQRRKAMKDELEMRERAGSNVKQTEKMTKPLPLSALVDDIESSLRVKVKLPPFTKNQQDYMEMIKSVLQGSETSEPSVYIIHCRDRTVEMVVEFASPRAAKRIVDNAPFDIVIKADWLAGYAPVIVETEPKVNAKTKAKPSNQNQSTHTDNDMNATESGDLEESANKRTYTEDFESSTLERLKKLQARKLQKQANTDTAENSPQ